MLDIPFCVAGGIRSVADAEEVLNAGAEKISVNSPALARPGARSTSSRERFGAQCVVVGIDSQTAPGGYRVYQFTGDPIAHARHAARHARLGARGAASAAPARSCSTAWLPTACARLRHRPAARGARACAAVPLVASGGAGAREHFADVFPSRRTSMPRSPPAYSTAAQIAIPELKR